MERKNKENKIPPKARRRRVKDAVSKYKSESTTTTTKVDARVFFISWDVLLDING